MSDAWSILSGVLVFFMQSGFAMLEAGCSRDKNVQSILMKNMIDVCVGTLGWFAVGFSFAYSFNKKTQENPSGFAAGTGTQIIGGDAAYFLKDSEVDYTSFFFQWTFCATAATIVSGGVAERVKFSAYLLYVIVMTTVIYPCIVASTWGGGLFTDVFDDSYVDFAGSGIVHLTGGVGALVGAVILGPRTGRFTAESDFHPHSMTLVTLGTLILWMGWFGFNCGSGSTAQAGLVACNTTVAAASCACMVFVITLIPGVGFAEKDKETDKEKIKLDLGGLCNGVLAGLVSITAGCANVLPWEAMIIGFIGGIFYVGSDLLLKKLKIDDPLNAFPVHGACGMWGLIAVGLFGRIAEHDPPTAVLGSEHEYKALVPNICLILFIWAWCGGISFIVFGGLHKANVLRVSVQDEERGLDKTYHIGDAYNNSPRLPKYESQGNQ